MPHILACPRVKVASCPARLPAKYIENLEQNQLIESCCRHPENHEVEAWFSCEDERPKGTPDIYKFYCTLRAHACPLLLWRWRHPAVLGAALKMVLHIVHSVLSAHPPTWPNASTTGVEARRDRATDYLGRCRSMSTASPIENQRLNGSFDSRMEVYGDNVTFRNCIFRNLSGMASTPPTRAGLTIDHCEFIAEGSTRTSAIGSAAAMRRRPTTISTAVLSAIQLTDGAATGHRQLHPRSRRSQPRRSRPPLRRHHAARRPAWCLHRQQCHVWPPDEGTTVVFIASQFADIYNIMVTEQPFDGRPVLHRLCDREPRSPDHRCDGREQLLEMGFYGYFLLENNDASIVIQDNVEWDEGVDATPAAVTAWLASL